MKKVTIRGQPPSPAPVPAAFPPMLALPPPATDKSIVVCLNPACPTPLQRYLRGLALSSHSDQCKLHVFGIEALLSVADICTYPSDELGKNIRAKLQKCGPEESYSDMLVEDFRATINKMLDVFKDSANRALGKNALLEAYQKVYSLQNVKEGILRGCSSAELTTMLITAHSGKNLDDLKEVNKRLDELNRHLNSMVEDMASILLHYERDSAVVRKDIVERRNPMMAESGQKQLNEVSYGMIKSTYLKSEEISADSGWLRFPESEPNHFKPWVYAQKGFCSGVHKLLIVSSQPSKHLNCGLAVIQQQDLNSYPYAIYKSLYDRVGRQFRLIKGVEINTFIDGNTPIELTMDLDHKKAILRDAEDRCQYVAQLRQAVVYYFGIVGELWSVRVIHLT